MALISEKSIEKIVDEVTPLVEQYTEMPAQLDSLNIKLINRIQYWEHGMKPLYDYLKVDTKSQNMDEFKKSLIAKRMPAFLFLGAYEPVTESIIIIPDNLKQGTNKSGIKLLVAHEMVHRCQFKNNTMFAYNYYDLVKAVSGKRLLDETGNNNKIGYLNALMTLAEGDASYIEDTIKEDKYPNAEKKASLTSLALTGIALLATKNSEISMWDKMKQYTRGKEIIQRMTEWNSRQGVNNLYNKDIEDIYDKFS